MEELTLEYARTLHAIAVSKGGDLFAPTVPFKLRWAYTYRNIRPGRLVDLLVERHLDDILLGD